MKTNISRALSVALLVPSVWACGGEGNDTPTGETQRPTTAAGFHHESHFLNDPARRARPHHTVLVELEHPQMSQPAGQPRAGAPADDAIPYTFDETREYTLCWEGKPAERSAHGAVLKSAGGEEVARLTEGGACVTRTMAAGDYVLQLEHGGDGKKETTAVFVRAVADVGKKSGARSASTGKREQALGSSCQVASGDFRQKRGTTQYEFYDEYYFYVTVQYALTGDPLYLPTTLNKGEAAICPGIYFDDDLPCKVITTSCENVWDLGLSAGSPQDLETAYLHVGPDTQLTLFSDAWYGGERATYSGFDGRSTRSPSGAGQFFNGSWAYPAASFYCSPPMTCFGFDSIQWSSSSKAVGSLIVTESTAVTPANARVILLQSNACAACNLSGADLSNADLANLDLSKADLRAANLRNATLTNTVLKGAIASGTDFTAATMDGADLDAAFAVGALFSSASLKKARLTNGTFIWTVFSSANLEAADLTGSNLDHAVFAKAKASGLVAGAGTNLTNANFTEATIGPGQDGTGGSLAGLTLTGSTFTKAILNKADLSNITASGVDFGNASLRETVLTGAHLENAVFTRADLTFADLSGAHLCGAMFNPAILAGAKLGGAFLGKDSSNSLCTRAAILSYSWMQGSDLSGAQMAFTRLDYVSWFGEYTLDGATRTASGSRATMTGAKFVDSVLWKLDLSAAHLEAATLDRAVLVNADLSNAFLGPDQAHQTSLVHANLRGATLSGADLKGADLTNAVVAARPSATNGTVEVLDSLDYLVTMSYEVKPTQIGQVDPTDGNTTCPNNRGGPCGVPVCDDAWATCAWTPPPGPRKPEPVCQSGQWDGETGLCVASRRHRD